MPTVRNSLFKSGGQLFGYPKRGSKSRQYLCGGLTISSLSIIGFDQHGRRQQHLQALVGSITFFASFTNGGVIEVGNGGEIIVYSYSWPQRRPDRNRRRRITGPRSGGTVSQGVEFTGAGGTLELDQNAGQIGTEISGLTVADSIDLASWVSQRATTRSGPRPAAVKEQLRSKRPTTRRLPHWSWREAGTLRTSP